MKPKFVLFDIDQTLLYMGGAGRNAMNMALEELTGLSNGFDQMLFVGKTDPQVFREALTLHGLRSDDDMIDNLTRRYLERFPSQVVETKAILKPGVPQILEAMESEEGIYTGLLTGNVEEGAKIKIGRFDLNRFFKVGAFGSDSENRNELLPVAIKRFKAATGLSVETADCVVVGDSPRDVE
jgi:phosphoglycolate phosphatase-like HAD superfamily hydrolase